MLMKVGTEPVHELIIITISLEQVHGTMRMGIHKTWENNVVFQLHRLFRIILLFAILCISDCTENYPCRQDIDDFSTVDDNGGRVQDFPVRYDRNNPLRMDCQVDNALLHV